MKITGKTKFKTNLFGFNIQKNAPSLKDGLEVKGVSLVQSESLRIR